MADEEKSPLEIALDAAMQEDLAALGPAPRRSFLEALAEARASEGEAKKRPRPDFHNLRVIKGGKK